MYKGRPLNSEDHQRAIVSAASSVTKVASKMLHLLISVLGISSLLGPLVLAQSAANPLNDLCFCDILYNKEFFSCIIRARLSMSDVLFNFR